jgi:hypothetical protein
MGRTDTIYEIRVFGFIYYHHRITTITTITTTVELDSLVEH